MASQSNQSLTTEEVSTFLNSTTTPSQSDVPEATNSKDNQVVKQDQVQAQQQNINPQPQAPVFFQIIDIVNEYQRGNFLPALHCLRYNLIPKNFLDYEGYNLLHRAVSQGSIPIVLLLLDHFKLDVNSRSMNQQTALMISVNFGLIEITRILCERGAQLHFQDNTGFTALLYCVKLGRIPETCYLLHQEADINAVDMNGCGVVHWAAYRDHPFLLKTFKSLGMNMMGLDTAGFTPLERAIQANALECINFLLPLHDKAPEKFKLDDVKHPDIKNILRKKFFPTAFEQEKQEWINIFHRKSRWTTFVVYFIAWLFYINFYLEVVMTKGMGLTLDLGFLLFALHFIGYAFWYYTRSYRITDKKKKKGFKGDGFDRTSGNESMEMMRLDPEQRMIYSRPLDRLVKGEDFRKLVQEEDKTTFPSFLHELAWQFENKRYKEIARFKEGDYCPICLIKRPERSAHHERSPSCVPHFHHYSYSLSKAVNKENHYLYLFLLLQQMVLLLLIVIGGPIGVRGMRGSVFFLVNYFFGILDTYSTFKAILYVLAVGMACYNAFFLGIEIYGVLKNETYYEIFNRTKLNYLLKIKQEKGGYFKNFYNPYNLGIWGNIKDYVMRVLKQFNLDEEREKRPMEITID